MKTIKLPPAFSVKEAQFIEKIWPDHKMPMLKRADGQKCRILDRKPPLPFQDSVFVRCKCEAWIEIKKGQRKTKIKTATILVLNEWIK